MTDDHIPDEDRGDMPPPQNFVSAEDFFASDFESPIAEIKEIDCHSLEYAYHAAAKDALGREPAFSVYRILASLCSLHFRSNNKAGAFGPKIVMGDRRSAIPEDWLGEQTKVFETIVDKVIHPALRARIADVVWTNDRSSKASKIAIDAYCEVAESFRSGQKVGHSPVDRDVSWEEMEVVERAIHIAIKTTKRGVPLPERLTRIIEEIYNTSRSNNEIHTLARIASIRFRHSLLDRDELCADIEAAAEAAAEISSTDPLSLKDLWDLAAAIHKNASRPDDQRRCQLRGVEQTIKMSEHMSPASAQAHWVRTAISELRNISGTEKKREELRLLMRRLQERSMEEMSSFSVPMDFGDEIDRLIDIFGRFNLPEALRQFAILPIPKSVDTLRSEVIESLHKSQIAHLFGSTHLDDEGKVIAEVEAVPMTGEPSENWIKQKMSQIETFNRAAAVTAMIHPAREFISSKFPIGERHFYFISARSPFVPDSHASIFALGFARFVQGDYISSAHILIPQIENSIRYVLYNSNTDSSTILNDLTQEDRTLSALLEQFRNDLDRVFSPDIVMQIDLLFNYRPGPALRHEMAHGKVGTGFCYHPDMVYACWFIFHLCCAPLIPHWKKSVAPAIEAGAY